MAGTIMAIRRGAITWLLTALCSPGARSHRAHRRGSGGGRRRSRARSRSRSRRSSSDGGGRRRRGRRRQQPPSDSDSSGASGEDGLSVVVDGRKEGGKVRKAALEAADSVGEIKSGAYQSLSRVGRRTSVGSASGKSDPGGLPQARQSSAGRRPAETTAAPGRGRSRSRSLSPEARREAGSRKHKGASAGKHASPSASPERDKKEGGSSKQKKTKKKESGEKSAKRQECSRSKSRKTSPEVQKPVGEGTHTSTSKITGSKSACGSSKP